MKNSIRLGVLIGLGTLFLYSQPVSEKLTLSYGTFDVSYSTQVQKGDVVLPFIEGTIVTPTKGRFGVLYKNSDGKSSVVDILDGAGKTLASVTVNDIIGKSSTGVKSVSSKTIGDRLSESLYTVSTSNGPVTLKVSALKAGDKENSNAPQQLIITFSLASKSEQNLALRVNLKVDGSATKYQNGVIVSGKTSASAISLVTLPMSNSADVKSNAIVFQSSAKAVSKETPLLWIVAEGAGSQKGAGEAITAAAQTMNAPKIVVVNTTSKPNAQPGDTVTYTLVCKNVGTGDATNVVITNPIPTGTLYLAGSASDTDMDVELDRENAPAPQMNPVTQIKWTLKNALRSGDEQNIVFKVLIQ